MIVTDDKIFEMHTFYTVKLARKKNRFPKVDTIDYVSARRK